MRGLEAENPAELEAARGARDVQPIRPMRSLTLAALVSMFCCSCASRSDEPVFPSTGEALKRTRAPAGSTDTLIETSYVDRSGEVRQLKFELRLPSSKAADLPVVVYSHGKTPAAADGERDPHVVGRAWGDVLVSAGYAFIAIAHTPRKRSSLDSLCHTLGVPAADCRAEGACLEKAECRRAWPSGAEGEEKGLCVAEVPGTEGQCSYFDYLSFDRPNDAIAVFDWLDAVSAPGGSHHHILDPRRLAYMGHSGGGGGTLMIAGAPRLVAGSDRLVVDGRPIAFVSLAVQGPDSDNFTEVALSGAPCRAQGLSSKVCLSRPQMFVTGLGDSPDVAESLNRRKNYELVPSGDKFLVWLTTAEGRHGMFNLESGDCASTDPSRCEWIASWLAYAGVAFLDNYLGTRAAPLELLLSAEVGRVTDGGMQVSER